MQNLLELIPYHTKAYERQPDATIHVLYPKFQIKLFKWLLQYLKNPFFHIRLDPLGSAVWEAIDGQKNVAQISEVVGNQLQTTIDEAWQLRVAKFIEHLYRGDLIHFQNLKKP